MHKGDISARIEELEQARQEWDQAKGAARQIQQDMKQEFGIDNLKAARRLLARMAREQKVLESELKKLDEEYEEAGRE